MSGIIKIGQLVAVIRESGFHQLPTGGGQALQQPYIFGRYYAEGVETTMTPAQMLAQSRGRIRQRGRGRVSIKQAGK